MNRTKLFEFLEFPLGEDNLIPRMHSTAKARWRGLIMRHAEELIKPHEEVARLREWQPIETAPKDGVRVLVFVRTQFRQNAPGYFITDAYCDDGDKWMTKSGGDSVESCGYKSNEGDYICTATHWMPLPNPPLTSEARHG